MKTFKTTKSIILATLLVVGTILTSCSKDDNESASIIGTWKVTSSVYETFKDGVSQGKDKETIDANNYWTISFKADGTFEGVSVDPQGNDKESGEYIVKNNEISVKYKGDKDFEPANFTVTKDQLIITSTEEYTYNGGKYKGVSITTYTRQ